MHSTDHLCGHAVRHQTFNNHHIKNMHVLKMFGGMQLKVPFFYFRIHIMFSSLKAFEKFELSLLVTPDYPFKPLQIQNFKSHIGNTRFESSVFI